MTKYNIISENCNRGSRIRAIFNFPSSIFFRASIRALCSFAGRFTVWRSPNSRLGLMILFFWLGIARVHCEVGVSVKGYFNVTAYRFVQRQPKVWQEKSSTNEFQASFGRDGHWKLEVRPVAQTNDVFYLSFDGTNTYCIEYLELTRGRFGPNGKPALLKVPISEKTNYSGINLGEFPQVGSDDQFRIRCLWLCLASGNYIRHAVDSSMPLPWEEPTRSLTAYGFRVESELSPDPPFAPVNLKFVRSSKLDLANLEEELNRTFLRAAREKRQVVEWNKELMQRKTFYTEGFVAGELQTEGVTNRHGFTLPRAFSCKVFYPGGGNPVCGSRYDGEITSISEIADDETFRPPVIAPLLVRDQRFRYRDSKKAIDRIDYSLATGEAWPAQDSPRLKSLFARQLADRNATAIYRHNIVRYRRIFTLACLAVLGIVLPYFLFKMGRRNFGVGSTSTTKNERNK